MRNPVEQPESPTEIEAEHRRARARLEAANARFARAVAESERLKRSGAQPASAVGEEELVGAALAAALEAAEANYRSCLAEMKTDSSDTARWRCARALIELDRLAEQVSARRVR
jgi:hypothetical protein